jgi:penicillin-binding protein 1C
MDGHPLRLLWRAAILVGVPTILTAAWLWLPGPALDGVLDGRPGARITDRTGALLAVLPGRAGSFQIRLAGAAIPPACSDLFIRLEDARFRAHPGVDPLALLREAVHLVNGTGLRSGASTITMQLARILHPHPGGAGGKLGEMVDALRLEARLSRDQVLAAYLNEVPFGRNARGIGAAAWTYFGADLSTLSEAQLLALAVIPRNPTLYDPFAHPGALAAAAERESSRLGLGLAVEEIDTAVRGAKTSRPVGGAPHFARYVQRLVTAETLVPVDGEVRTTLDLALNREVEATVRFVLDRYSSARVTNAAAVVIDNRTGSVLAWVGSRGFEDETNAGQIDGVLIRRQSASTLKPFLYARAVEKGWTAATLLPDAPLAFGSPDEEAYRPQNFDKRSHGVVRLRTALASSLNVPAVFTLSRVGVPDFVETLRAVGFSVPSDAASRYGLGMAVGNAEVSLLELTHAFSVFPRGGTLAPLRVSGGPGKPPERVFDPFAAWIITSILSDPSARATGFGTHTYFRVPFPAMFKSGTSSEFTNLWSIGATPSVTAGVWAGNFDGRAVRNKTGSIVPTQILTDALERASERLTDSARGTDFARPAGVVEARICTDTGGAAVTGCPSTRVEYFRDPREVPGPRPVRSRDPDELLRETFLDDAHSVRILFPIDGQVFFRDETVAPEVQAVPLLLVARPGVDVSVALDGRVAGIETAALGLSLPLTPGVHTVIVSAQGASQKVTFSVR